jgi:hypothetical protein
MNGNGAIHLASPPEQAPQGELDFGRVAALGHARENLGRVVEAIVDEMVEAHVVIPWEAHSARRTIAAAKDPGRKAYRYEC